MNKRTDADVSDGIIVRLLQLDFEHHRKIGLAYDAGVELGSLSVDLLPVILDAIGVPAEASFKLDGGEPFSRDFCWFKYDEMVQDGSEDQCRRYIQWVRSEMCSLEAVPSK